MLKEILVKLVVKMHHVIKWVDPDGLANSNTFKIGELMSAVVTVIWGLWIMNPFWDIYAVPIYGFVSIFLPEWVYGFIPVVLGIGQFVGYRFDIYKLRITSTSLLTCFWIFVTVGFMLTDTRLTAIPVYGCAVILEFILFISIVDTEYKGTYGR